MGRAIIHTLAEAAGSNQIFYKYYRCKGEMKEVLHFMKLFLLLLLYGNVSVLSVLAADVHVLYAGLERRCPDYCV